MKSYLLKCAIALTVIAIATFQIEAYFNLNIGSIYVVIISVLFVATGVIPVFQKDRGHVNIYYGYFATIPVKFFIIGATVVALHKLTQVDVIQWFVAFFFSYVCLQAIELHHLLKSDSNLT